MQISLVNSRVQVIVKPTSDCTSGSSSNYVNRLCVRLCVNAKCCYIIVMQNILKCKYSYIFHSHRGIPLTVKAMIIVWIFSPLA